VCQHDDMRSIKLINNQGEVLSVTEFDKPKYFTEDAFNGESFICVDGEFIERYALNGGKLVRTNYFYHSITDMLDEQMPKDYNIGPIKDRYSNRFEDEVVLPLLQKIFIISIRRFEIRAIEKLDTNISGELRDKLYTTKDGVYYIQTFRQHSRSVNSKRIYKILDGEFKLHLSTSMPDYTLYFYLSRINKNNGTELIRILSHSGPYMEKEDRIRLSFYKIPDKEEIRFVISDFFDVNPIIFTDKGVYKVDYDINRISRRDERYFEEIRLR